eukprot:3911715-Rhodomonas_salina.1
MDHQGTMAQALLRKQRQYLAAERAITRAHVTALLGPNATQRAQLTVRLGLNFRVDTVPFIFGTRGAVMAKECLPFLRTLGIKTKGCEAILAAGVRAAISSAADMCHARMVAPKPPQAKTPK